MHRTSLIFIAVVAAVTGCGGKQPSSTVAPTTTPSAATTVKPPTPPPASKRLAMLSVNELPAKTTSSELTIRGRVTRGATVTARGKEASLNRGRFRVSLDLHKGVNRFTIIVRHPNRRTRRRPVRIDRTAPSPPQTAATSGCPPGQVRRIQMGTSFCGPPVPTSCPSGQAPVNATATCEPVPDAGKVPCTYGDGLCTPEENAAESATESYCGGYDPSRVQPDGSYLPKPGC